MSPKIKQNQSEEEKKFQKKINRILYKINDGTKELETQEYFDYLEGKIDEYPEENITDITHSFLLAINTFLSVLQVRRIKDIRLVTYLPLRFQSREIAASQRSDEERKEFEERNEQIQRNITNKLIRTFRRLSIQNPNIVIEQLPYEVDEFLSAKVDSGKPITNEILSDTSLKIKLKSVQEFYK
jgi:hypothetical protein